MAVDLFKGTIQNAQQAADSSIIKGDEAAKDVIDHAILQFRQILEDYTVTVKFEKKG